MNNTLIKSSCFIVYLVSFQLASALEVGVAGGYDTNPYELSGRVDGAQYTNIDILHKGKKRFQKKTEIRYQGSLNSRVYENAFEDADYHQLNLRGRFIHRFKIAERKANVQLTSDWRSDRRTYFSQSQRALASTRGNTIPDRFDYDSAKLAAELTYQINKIHSLSLYSYFTARNYTDDYKELNLESLDFLEYSIQSNYRYKHTQQKLRARLFIYFRKRHYEGLLEDDLSGANRINDKLRYSFNGYGVFIDKTFGMNLNLNFYANGYFARDDAVGFRDFDFHQLRLGLNYTISKTTDIMTEGTCYNRDFILDVASPVENETGYAGRLREGCKAHIRYKAAVPKLEKYPLRWHALVGTEFETNASQQLSYDKYYASLSLNYQF